MSAPLRNQVLQCFRSLHRTRRRIFVEDPRALEAARLKINSEFQKYKKISGPEAISELVKFGNQAEEILRTSVIQARPVNETTFAIKMHKDTAMFNNVPYTG